MVKKKLSLVIILFSFLGVIAVSLEFLSQLEYTRISALDSTSNVLVVGNSECFHTTKAKKKIQFYITKTERGCSDIDAVYFPGGPGAEVSQEEFARYAFLFPYQNLALINSPGTGKSTALSRTEYTVTKLVGDYVEFVRLRSKTKTVFVGGSWGAILASRIAVAMPNEVEGLVLISPGPMPIREKRAGCEAMQLCYEIKRSLKLKVGYSAFLKEWAIRYKLIENSLKKTDTKQKQVVRLVDKSGIEVVSNLDLAKSHTETPLISKRYSRQFPVIIVFGSNDNITNHDRSGYFQLFPQAKSIQLDGYGHALPSVCETFRPIAEFGVQLRRPENSVTCSYRHTASIESPSQSNTELELLELDAKGRMVPR
jgi:pimeloyl-ACP methyl ester carboxylesterase